jgi:hypothetical protein
MTEAANAPATQERPNFPPPYRKVVPLARELHATVSLRQVSHLKIAAGLTSSIVTGAEMPMAAIHYPIVFWAGDKPRPMAMFGTKSGQNLFIDENGRWDPDAYVPAYLRRYPFIMADLPDGRSALCVDDNPDYLVESDIRPLFSADGKPTDIVNGALSFCQAFGRDMAATDRFTTLLKEFDLLVPRQANLRTNSGRNITIDGFLMVDEARLNALDAAKFKRLREAGALGWIYAHLVSLNNWSRLANRVGRLADATAA